MKRFVFPALAALGVFLGYFAQADGNVSGKVTAVRIDKDGRAMVTFSNAIGGSPPGCVISAYSKTFAFDTNAAGGKSILATVLAAKVTGASVTAYGTGACSVYGNWVEDWSTGQIE